MEVIDKKEYISKIEVVRILQKAYAEGRIKAKDGLASVLDDVNASDVQPVDRWISVEDSLPEERKCVLVYDGGVCIAWRYKGEWESDDYTLATVAYWQPLPDPPVNL